MHISTLLGAQGVNPETPGQARAVNSLARELRNIAGMILAQVTMGNNIRVHLGYECEIFIIIACKCMMLIYSRILCMFHEQSISPHIKICAYAFKILALECHHVSRYVNQHFH